MERDDVSLNINYSAVDDIFLSIYEQLSLIALVLNQVFHQLRLYEYRLLF